MIPYILVYSFSLICFFFSDKARRGKTWFSMLGVFSLALLAGVRDDSVGADTSLYVFPTFQQAIELQGDFLLFFYSTKIKMGLEEFYICLNYLVAMVTDSPHCFLFAIESLLLLLIVLPLKKLRFNLLLPMFVFMMLFMRETFNALRQSLALAFCVLVLSQMMTGTKFRWILLTMICAVGFHHSALIFFIVILLYKLIKRFPLYYQKNAVKFLFILCGLIALIFVNQILTFFLGLGIGEEKYIEAYGSSDEYGSNIPVNVIALTMFNLWVFYQCKRKCSILIQRNEFTCFAEYVLLFSVLLCGSALIATFLIRINSYFIWLSVIILPYYLNKSNSKNMIFITVSFYLFYWIMTVYIANLGYTLPYKSKLIGV